MSTMERHGSWAYAPVRYSFGQSYGNTKNGVRGRGVVCTAVIALLGGGIASDAGASFIDFETLPGGGVITDNMVLDSQYSSLGVLFGLDDDGDGFRDVGSSVLFEAVGNDDSITGSTADEGFLNDAASNFPFGPNFYDQERVGQVGLLGNFFLRTPGGLSGTDGTTLAIEYTSGGTVLASGEIWDIDGNSFFGTERWEIRAHNAAGAVIATILSPEGTTVDNGLNPYEAGRWGFVFDVSGTGEMISTITFTFVGTKTSSIGLAFDNFNAFDIPAPGSVTLLGLGALALARRRR
ncbi:MAG: PEP-CTERM sorting domain-containing protein [Phycisphaerales bacterium JB043]